MNAQQAQVAAGRLSTFVRNNMNQPVSAVDLDEMVQLYHRLEHDWNRVVHAQLAHNDTANRFYTFARQNGVRL